MTTTISSELNQGYRNALLSYYLGQYIPNSGDDDLISLVQTPEDAYEYLLIDPLVNNDVQTSRVAQAMSSIQQYINSIVLNMAPGYNTQNLDNDQIVQWNDGANQYSIWGGYVELDTYPENYLDPTLRKNKTEYFEELENSLNQNNIDSSTAHDAVMQYLNDFEQVANLDIVSGYIDGLDILSDTYYLVGKGRTSPVKYYWRNLTMSENVDNTIPVGAWSEWKEINVAINADATIGRIRPVVFNNRIYIIWFEKSVTSQNVDTSADTSEDIYTISGYASFLNYDGTWTAPDLLQSITSDDSAYAPLFMVDDPDEFYTIAAHYIPGETDENESLVVSVYVDQDDTYCDFTIQIDYWFSQRNIADNYLGNNCYAEFGSGDGQKFVQCIRSMSSAATGSITKNATGNSFPSNTDMLTNLQDLTASDISYADGNITINSVFAASTLAWETIEVKPSGHNYEYAQHLTEPGVQFDLKLAFNYPALTLSGTIKFPDDAYIGNIDHTTLSEFYFYDKTAGTSQLFSLTSGRSSFNESNMTWTLNEIDVTLSNIKITDNHDYAFTFHMYNNRDAGGVYEDIISDNFMLTSPGTRTWTLDAYNGEWAGDKLIGTVSEPDIDYGTIFPITTPYTLGYFEFSWGILSDTSQYAWENYTINIVPSSESISVPSIETTSLSPQGQAQYLKFPDTVAFPDSTPVTSIRLNTLFVKELINKANISIDNLLTWDTQLTEEPPLEDSDAPAVMDFSGANGLYFWELFFHMPYLVAYRLFQEAQYGDAQQWFNYIFDPAARGRTSSNQNYPEPDFWNVRPLVETGSAEAAGTMVLDPTDPDAIATADPVHYQKSIVMAYVSNLIATADADYRLLTNDGLSLAKLRYCQVKDLLGPRPDIKILNQWQPDTLDNVAEQANIQLTALEFSAAETLNAFPGKTYAVQNAVDNPEFLPPLNTQLLQYWNTVDSRLYNLRHNLSIDGQPITIPLYAALANPTQLLQQTANAGSLSNTAAVLSSTLPPYRFSTMLQSVRAAVATLSQFGQTLLSYYERGESAGLQELQQQQALNLSSFTISLQRQSISALDADQQALVANRTIAQQRYDHYYTLYTNGLSAGESSAMALRDTANVSMAAASPFITAGMALKTIPNIFGLADGGAEPGAPTLAAGMVLQLTGEVTGLTAQQTEMSEGYRRRSEEWQIQYQQAQSEVEAINKQLDALAIRQQAAQTSLQMSQTEQSNLQDTLSFMMTRFTRSSLYNWLTGQLSSLYYQAYDAVLSLCLSTQACWQYEMGDITSTFIQTSAWNDSYHGLLVGETLTLNLLQMESAWLLRNQRRLELTKTVSLKQLLGDDAFASLSSSGTTNFTLSESLFDNDYPGHYLRQIKFVTVSLPTLVGPYQDVRMTLTQSGSSTLLKADIDGVNYLNDSTKGNADNIVSNMRASQQIAVSAGLSDSGLFMLSFGDERYLPFEGTGAVSSWQLNFPRHQSDEQQAILSNLSDVIVQVHYTALYGGSSFEKAVENTL